MTTPARDQLQELVAQMVRDHFRRHPAHATWAGVHEHDHRLGDFTPDAVADEVVGLKRHLAAFRSLPAGELAPEERVDRALCINALEDGIQELEQDRVHERKPDLYPDEVIHGCYLLVARSFAPAAERGEALLRRLGEIPRVLAEGKANLRQPARVHVEVTMESVAGGISFFRGLIPAFAAQVPDLQPHLVRASEQAAAAFQDYLDFLQQTVLPRATGDFALGRERFEWKLKHSYLLPYDAESLHERGHELVRETLAAMESLARRIDPTAHWQDIVHGLRTHTPSPAELVDTYRTILAEARQFCLEHDLVDLPPGERLRIEETPLFYRPTLAYAAYMAPAPFEPEGEGIFFVTPIDEQASPAAQADQLSGHNYPSIKTTVLHEAYPGHHVQLAWAIRHPSLVRKLLGNTLFMEGWTLYCEQMMVEQGWLRTPEEQLIQLKDQLWRACRVVLDSGLHALGMSVDHAESTLRDVAALEEPAARTEVRGYYCNMPTVPMSYLIGKQELLRLKADYQRLRGDQFRLKEFHNTLLRHGSIPFAYIRELMLPDAPA